MVRWYDASGKNSTELLHNVVQILNYKNHVSTIPCTGNSSNRRSTEFLRPQKFSNIVFGNNSINFLNFLCLVIFRKNLNNKKRYRSLNPCIIKLHQNVTKMQKILFYFYKFWKIFQNLISISFVIIMNNGKKFLILIAF